MLSTAISIRRSSGLWGGVLPETVERYRKELEELKKRLEDASLLYEHNLFGSEPLMTEVQAVIAKEIKYCLFYEEYRSRRTSEPNFGEWVFTKQEDIKPKHDWLKVPSEQWTKTNGRVKAIIQFDRSGIMVKLTLEYQNDSDSLTFFIKGYQHVLPSVHVKSAASIEAKVQEFKSQADAFLEEHMYPLYDTTDFDLLKQLLLL